MTSRNATSYLPLADEGTAIVKAHRTKADVAHLLLFGALQWPWLLRSLSGGTKAQKRALLARLDLPADALPNLGSWKADTGFLTLIVDHILEHRPQTVLELGAGASSLIVARALEKAGGGKQISCDQHGPFIAATREWLGEHGVTAEMRATPLAPAPGDWPGVWYDHGPLPDRIDLIIIDGPPWTIHPYVRGAAETLFDRLPVGGTILLDDGARLGERVVARRWRRRWPNFRFDLIRNGTKGTLVGRRVR